MSPEVPHDTYGHHYPDDLQGAAAAIAQKGRYVSVAEAVVSFMPARSNEKSKTY